MSTLKIDEYRLPAEKARRVLLAEELTGKVSLDIPIEFVGQERAKKALEMVLSSTNSFHLVVVAESLNTKAIRDFCLTKLRERKEAGESFPLKDFCYVHNFEDPESPWLLAFEKGEGELFKKRVDEIPLKLQLFSEEEYSRKKEDFEQKAFDKVRADFEKIFNDVQKSDLPEKLKPKGWVIGIFVNKESKMVRVALGYVKEGGKIIYDPKEQERYKASLSPEQRAEYEKNEKEALALAETEKLMTSLNMTSQRYRANLAKGLIDLKNNACRKAAEVVFRKLSLLYKNNQKALDFLTYLKDYSYKEREIIIFPKKDENNHQKHNDKEDKEAFLPFLVNLFVNSKDFDLPPVWVAKSPTYSELFGKIERLLSFGEFEIKTNHALIRAGIFHVVNKGVAILDLTDIAFTKEPVYLGLKRILSENQLRIRDPQDEYGVSFVTKTLNPEPMPLESKIIAIIHPSIYYGLWHHIFDQGLINKFEIKAEFGATITLNKDDAKSYASWLDDYVQNKGFLPLELKAKAKIIEYMMREAESQDRMLWDIEKIKALVKESYSYAKREQGNEIKEGHVQKAIAEKIYRSNLFEEQLRRLIKEGKILIEIDGDKIGQINGLGVYSMDDYRFGMPTRTVARTFRGENGLIDIDRESGLVNETHTKGLETIKSFFSARYGQKEEPNFGGRINFEQEFEGTGGPSASSAQIFALLSSLSEKPIKQCLAVTGTCDQYGNAQVIGGVNQKIEGFYYVCKERGLTGKQGVIIPKSNLKDLMLSDEVVQAIKDGRFHVFAIETIDQGIEILMDCPAKEVDEAIVKKLKRWSNHKKKFGLF